MRKVVIRSMYWTLCLVTAWTAGDVSAGVTLSHISTVYLPYDVSGPTPLFRFSESGVEQISYDTKDKLFYIVGRNIIHVVNGTDPVHLTRETSLMVPDYDLTHVNVCGEHVLVTAHDLRDPDLGQLRVYRKYSPGGKDSLQLVDAITVGSLPDMLYSLPDCHTFLIALEAEAYLMANGSVKDPEGGFVIVQYLDGVEGNFPAIVTKLDFRAFNDKYQSLQEQGVRFVYREDGNLFSNDLEPEYVTVDSDTNTAYVTLQENNAVAEVDLLTQTITNIYGLGHKQHGFLDASDRDGGIEVTHWPIRAFYMPDIVQFHQWKGRRLIFTANEGDAKEYGNVFDETIRGTSLANASFDQQVPIWVREALANDAKLGRLKFSAVDGKDSNGRYHNLYTYGGRSFSIWDADNSFAQLYDSGSDLEMMTAQYCPHLFNTNGDGIDGRSDDKGPETESIEVVEIDGRLYVFLGNERPGTVAVYSIGSDVTQPRFETIYCGGIPDNGKTMQQMYDAKELHGVDPEVIRYIPASDSPAGYPVLLVSGSVSNTFSLLRVSVTDDHDPEEDPGTSCPGPTFDPNNGAIAGPQVIVLCLGLLFCRFLTRR